MRLTKRCEDLLHLLRAARWLSTGQVHRRFFPQATADAARKRLRILTLAGYLLQFREHRMSEALFTLGPEGKRVLEKDDGKEITLERKPPKQLEHFLAINDVRIAAELAGSLTYFFACWELPGADWRYNIIPDAVFSMHNRTFAVEVDRGVETVRFFIKTKIPSYRNGLPGFPITAILIITDRKARMKSLARAVSHDGSRFLFSTIDLVRKRGLMAPIFSRQGNREEESLFSKSLDEKRVWQSQDA
jgi:Replication-relaxation